MYCFLTLTEDKICKIISTAKQNILYICPGITQKVAEEIVYCFNKCNISAVCIVLDMDPQVCRLGYGELKGIELLNCNGIQIKKSKGLRLGVLIIDNIGYAFTPVPLLIEGERNDEGSNAILINQAQVQTLLQSFIFDTSNISNTKTYKSEDYKNNNINIKVEPVKKKDLFQMKEDLAASPPMKFDMARQVRVYQSYIQFVELSLSGGYLKRHAITIPQELYSVSNSVVIQDRIKTTYKLIDDNSKVSTDKIEKEIQRIRKLYIRSLGSRYGTVILRQKKEEFEKHVNEVEKLLEIFKKESEKKLDVEFKKCRDALVKLFLPGIKKKPPIGLLAGISNSKPTTEQVKQYIERVLNTTIPSAKAFVEDIRLFYHYKDVTYETLNNEDFIRALYKVYPDIKWPNEKPFVENKAMLASKE